MAKRNGVIGFGDGGGGGGYDHNYGDDKNVNKNLNDNENDNGNENDNENSNSNTDTSETTTNNNNNKVKMTMMISRQQLINSHYLPKKELGRGAFGIVHLCRVSASGLVRLMTNFASVSSPSASSSASSRNRWIANANQK